MIFFLLEKAPESDPIFIITPLLRRIIFGNTIWVIRAIDNTLLSFR
jgi:hypothetical protein